MTNSDTPNTSRSGPPATGAEQTLAYWTEERRHAAQPIQPPDAERIGEQRGEIDLSAPPQTTESAPGPGSAANPGLTLPQVYTTALVAHPDRYPHRTVGKLFFRVGNDDRVASAAVVDEVGILTAAHCVQDPGERPMVYRRRVRPRVRQRRQPRLPDLAGGRDVHSHRMARPAGGCRLRLRLLPDPCDARDKHRGRRRLARHRHQPGRGPLLGQPRVPRPAHPRIPFRRAADVELRRRLYADCRRDDPKGGKPHPGASGGPWIVLNDDGKFYAIGTYSMWFNNPPNENSTPYFRDVVLQLFHAAFG